MTGDLVRILRLIRCCDGIARPLGDVDEVSRWEAARLVAGGEAVYVDEPRISGHGVRTAALDGGQLPRGEVVGPRAPSARGPTRR